MGDAKHKKTIHDAQAKQLHVGLTQAAYYTPNATSLCGAKLSCKYYSHEQKIRDLKEVPGLIEGTAGNV